MIKTKPHVNPEVFDNIDYKNVEFLKRFISSQGKILDPKYSGAPAKAQRKLAIAIKRARFLGLISPTSKN